MSGAEPAPWLSPALRVCEAMVAPEVTACRRFMAAAQVGGDAAPSLAVAAPAADLPACPAA